MTPEQAWTIAGAVLTSLAGGAAIVLALSSWLARSWARRMLEEDRARYDAELDFVKRTYTHELEHLKDDFAVYGLADFTGTLEIGYTVDKRGRWKVSDIRTPKAEQ